MKINSIDTNHQRNDEHFQFFTEFKDLATAEGLEKDEANKKIVKSEFTAKLQKADRARDEIFIGMSEAIRAQRPNRC